MLYENYKWVHVDHIASVLYSLYSCAFSRAFLHPPLFYCTTEPLLFFLVTDLPTDDARPRRPLLLDYPISLSLEAEMAIPPQGTTVDFPTPLGLSNSLILLRLQLPLYALHLLMPSTTSVATHLFSMMELPNR